MTQVIPLYLRRRLSGTERAEERECSRQAVIYPDPLNPGRSIIRCYPGGAPSGAVQQRVNLYREGTEYLLIDGVRYPMTQNNKGEK